MKTIRLKKRSLTDQIALLRMEILLLQERVRQLEPRGQYIGGGQMYDGSSVAEPYPYPGYPRPYVGDLWPMDGHTITYTGTTFTSKLPEEKA